MQKRRRPIVTLAVIIIVCTVILGVAVLAVSAYSSANIDHKLDEALFAAARSETVTRLYYDTSEYSASDINNYIAAEYEEVSYGGVRKTWYSYSELSEYLKEGFVAMEDRSFWSHGGVDVKRSAGAALNYIIGRDSYGGSTITQQVVKNISGDAQHTLKRKLNEIIRSRYIENTHTKEEIFEVYLNVIPMSENVAGVGAAAEEYFGKHPSELDIAEAATLIGIANAPSRYNPYNNPEAVSYTHLFMALRVIVLIIGTSTLLTYTTSPIALTDGIESLLYPLKLIHVPVHLFAMMMTIALRFIPTLVEETEKIMNAQKSRGADFTSGSLIKRAKALIPILIPLFVSSFKRAEELATAMECRCYRGDKNRTKLVKLSFKWRDLVFFILGAAFIALIVAMRTVPYNYEIDSRIYNIIFYRI